MAGGRPRDSPTHGRGPNPTHYAPIHSRQVDALFLDMPLERKLRPGLVLTLEGGVPGSVRPVSRRRKLSTLTSSPLGKETASKKTTSPSLRAVFAIPGSWMSMKPASRARREILFSNHYSIAKTRCGCQCQKCLSAPQVAKKWQGSHRGQHLV